MALEPSKLMCFGFYGTLIITDWVKFERNNKDQLMVLSFFVISLFMAIEGFRFNCLLGWYRQAR